MDNGQEPATKHAAAGLRSERNRHYDDLKEAIRNMEANLLNAFRTFEEYNRTRRH